MITPDLAADIKSGVAQYKTFVAGIGAANRLSVPNNSRIIICDLLIMPFVDRTLVPAGAERLRTYVYEFTSDKSKNFFTIRHQFQTVVDAGVIVAYQMEPPIKIDTYLVHTSEVRINVYHFPRVTAAVVTFAPLDDVSQEPRPPEGYGTKTTGGVNVVTNAAFPGDNQIIPVGAKNNDPVVTAITPRYVDQVKSSVIAANGLANPVTTGQENSYPIINIGYVLYENVIDKKVKSS